MNVEYGDEDLHLKLSDILWLLQLQSGLGNPSVGEHICIDLCQSDQKSIIVTSYEYQTDMASRRIKTERSRNLTQIFDLLCHCQDSPRTPSISTGCTVKLDSCSRHRQKEANKASPKDYSSITCDMIAIDWMIERGVILLVIPLISRLFRICHLSQARRIGVLLGGSKTQRPNEPKR